MISVISVVKNTYLISVKDIIKKMKHRMMFQVAATLLCSKAVASLTAFLRKKVL